MDVVTEVSHSLVVFGANYRLFEHVLDLRKVGDRFIVPDASTSLDELLFLLEDLIES